MGHLGPWSDVRFIHLAFCDVFGRQKNIAILPSELPRAFSYGIAIDASAIRGFGGQVHSDLFLHPLPQTLTLLPWRPEQGKLVQMQCKVSCPDGSPFENDTRSLLIRAVEEAGARGLRFSFGAELEFYLFCLDDQGNQTRVPVDQASYMDSAPDDRGEGVRREICMMLQELGIQPEGAHHEEGPSQNEIDFRYSDALSAADNAMAFRRVVKTVAARNGLWADFSPRPLENAPGSGFHINISVQSATGEDLLGPMIAGILRHTGEITVFLNPLEGSYTRLGRDKAPRFITWSAQNRSHGLRPADLGRHGRDYGKAVPSSFCGPEPLHRGPGNPGAVCPAAGIQGGRRSAGCLQRLFEGPFAPDVDRQLLSLRWRTQKRGCRGALSKSMLQPAAGLLLGAVQRNGSRPLQVILRSHPRGPLCERGKARGSGPEL